MTILERFKTNSSRHRQIVTPFAQIDDVAHSITWGLKLLYSQYNNYRKPLIPVEHDNGYNEANLCVYKNIRKI